MIFTRFAPAEARYAYRWDARAGWLFGLYVGMTAPFFGVIARRMGASAFEIALLIATPFLGHLASMIVAWHMQNRAKKPYMLWLAVLTRGLLLFIAFATTTKLFIGLIIASQVIGCLIAPAYAPLMKDAYPDACRGWLMGMVRIGMTFASMVAGLSVGQLMDRGLPLYWVVLLAGGAALLLAHELQRNVARVAVIGGLLGLAWLGAPYLAAPVSYRVIIPIGAVFGLLAAWAFNHMPEAAPCETAAEERFNILDGLATLARDRRFGLYSLAFFTFGFGNLLQGPLVPLFQVDELRISDQWVGILAMVTSGTSMIFYLVWGRVMDRYSPFIAVILSFALFGLSPLVYANAHSIPTLLLAACIVGMAGPGIDLMWLNAVLHFTDRASIPRYTAVHMFLVGIRGLLAPFVGTWLLQGVHVTVLGRAVDLPGLSLRQCFYVSAGLIWAGTLFMAVVVAMVILPYLRHRAVPGTAAPVPES